MPGDVNIYCCHSSMPGNVDHAFTVDVYCCYSYMPGDVDHALAVDHRKRQRFALDWLKIYRRCGSWTSRAETVTASLSVTVSGVHRSLEVDIYIF